MVRALGGVSFEYDACLCAGLVSLLTARPQKTGQEMEGRKEKRSPRTLRVLLSSGTQPVVAEYASTENVSSYGVRVQTDRPWKANTRVLIRSSQAEPWARARVVYCQTLKSHNFALGLEFLARNGDWMLAV